MVREGRAGDRSPYPDLGGYGKRRGPRWAAIPRYINSATTTRMTRPTMVATTMPNMMASLFIPKLYLGKVRIVGGDDIVVHVVATGRLAHSAAMRTPTGGQPIAARSRIIADRNCRFSIVDCGPASQPAAPITKKSTTSLVRNVTAGMPFLRSPAHDTRLRRPLRNTRRAEWGLREGRCGDGGGRCRFVA